MACGCEKQVEKVGQVTVGERDEIQGLFERKNALRELAIVLKEQSASSGEVDEPMYEKVVKDLGETTTKFQSWWDRMAQKYQWKNLPNGSWRINFETCEIYLESAVTCESN